MAALEKEIEALKSELDKIKKFRLDRIQSTKDCMSNFTNVLMN